MATKALTKYKPISIASPSMGLNAILIIGLIALMFFLLWRQRSSSGTQMYQNDETVTVGGFNSLGLPTEFHIKRTFSRM